MTVQPSTHTSPPPRWRSALEPARKLDDNVNVVDIVRHDLNEVFRALPSDAPLFAVADLVTALCHLRQAAVAIDRAADLLEAAEVML